MLRTRVDCRLEKKNSIKRFRSLALLLSLQRFPFRFEKFPRSNRTNPSPFPFFPPPPISTQLFPKLDFFFVPQSREGRFSLHFSLLRFSIHLSIPRSFSPLKGKKPFSTRVNKSSRREEKKREEKEGKGKNSGKGRSSTPTLPETGQCILSFLFTSYKSGCDPDFGRKLELDRGRIFETTGSNCPEGNCINCNCQSLFEGELETLEFLINWLPFVTTPSLRGYV